MGQEQLIKTVEQALENVADEVHPAILALWASRGGGKSQFLSTLRAHLKSRPGVAVIGIFKPGRSPAKDFAWGILEEIRSCQQERIMVLLDDLDDYTDIDQEILESVLVMPLLKTHRTLLVVTARREPEWEDFSVQERQVVCHINPLTRAETEILATEWGTDPEQVWSDSMGFPQILGWIQQEPQLAKAEILDRVSHFFLEELDPENRDFAKGICLVPIFNVYVAQLISSATESSYAEYAGRIHDLTKIGMLIWTPEVGYRFTDGVQRRLLAEDSRQQDPVHFRAVHLKAAKYYKDEARHAGYLHFTFVSAIYHMARASEVDGPEARASTCLQWLQQMDPTWIGVDWDRVHRMWSTGAGDLALVDELQELIGASGYARVGQFIEQAKQYREAS